MENLNNNDFKQLHPQPSRLTAVIGSLNREKINRLKDCQSDAEFRRLLILFLEKK